MQYLLLCQHFENYTKIVFNWLNRLRWTHENEKIMEVSFSNQITCSVTELDETSPDDHAFELANSWLNQGIELSESIAAAAAVACGCRWAMVNKVLPGSTKVQILALYDNGVFVDCFTYDFQKTPCEEVLANEKFCHFDDVQRAFPGDKDLEVMGVEDYAGKAFRNRKHELAGHLVVMHDRHMANQETVERVVNRLVSLLKLEWDDVYQT